MLDKFDPVPQFDEYLAWEYPDDNPTWDNEVYSWGNKKLGRGEDGFAKAIAIVRSLPTGTRVLVYPAWVGCKWYGGMVYTAPPWFGTRLFRDLLQAAEERNIILILSPRDHQGELRAQSTCRHPTTRANAVSGRFVIDYDVMEELGRVLPEHCVLWEAHQSSQPAR